MPTNSAHWNELTEFQHCQPSPLAFRALASLLDTWPGDDQAAAIDYAEKMLAKWPDAVRLAPWSWCKAVSKGEVLPTWHLVRSLELASSHLTKGTVNLAKMAHHGNLVHITELFVPTFSDFPELSFLCHRPETLPALRKLRAVDKTFGDGEVRALTESPLWQTLEEFAIEDLTDSLVHRKDASRIVPHFIRPDRIRSLSLRSPDLIAAWEANRLPQLRSASVIIRSVDEAREMAARQELAQLTSLSVAFRCGFSGSSPFEPFLGNVIEADEAAADVFFGKARLNRLETLAIFGYRMGYWGREGLGRLGLDALIASGLLRRLKHLRLELLPLGDKGIAALAPSLGKHLEMLELVDVYCKGEGAAALIASPCMPSLRQLDLSGNRIDADCFVEMASVDMPHLESLDLSGPDINPYYWNIGQQPLLDRGAAAWANNANARKLRSLRLANCHLTDAALVATFQSSKLRKLEELDLSHNSFTDAAIAQAVVKSPRWQTLRALGINNCRLNDAAIDALTRVQSAPGLRSLLLSYNNIGPKGAAALASWSVLCHAWKLDLHDNIIGDEGLIALAKSPNLGRLIELDLEQDCWNSRTFTFSDKAARALAKSQSLIRLDSLFSGCVDEYHGCAYSPGFTKANLDAVRRSSWMRPACKATCSDFSGVSEYIESKPFQEDFDEETEMTDGDFRRDPILLNDREAESEKHNMQQLRATAAKPAFDFAKPPEILAELPKLDLDGNDIVEGLEFRDPKTTGDVSLALTLSLEDTERPLPQQAGKFLSDTLGSFFTAAALGSFEVSGAGSRQRDDGRDIPTDEMFTLGIKGDPQPALQHIREVLWWIGAPEDTKLERSNSQDVDLERFRLDLKKKPAKAATRILQLATLKIERWNLFGKPGHRIDRIPLTKKQRKCVQDLLAELKASVPTKGWVHVETGDGGRMAVFVKYLKDSANFDTLNILAEKLTPAISGFAYKLMLECDFMLLPMAFAASAGVAGTIDCNWPKIEVVPSASPMHELLSRGPFHWWKHK